MPRMCAGEEFLVAHVTRDIFANIFSEASLRSMEVLMALTLSEATTQRQAAVAVLEFLNRDGVATFQQVQDRLPAYDEKTLLRAIALASSKGGLSISISKKMFGLTRNFSVVDVSDRTLTVIAILHREIEMTQQHEELNDPQPLPEASPSAEVVTALCPFSIRPNSKVAAPGRA
jgi:hypothetical protein